MKSKRKTFANTLRSDLKFRRVGRQTEVSGDRLSYRVNRADHKAAELLNSKIPVTTLTPPQFA